MTDMTHEDSNSPRLIMKHGGMTYLVALHFNENSKETMNSKLNRLLRKELQDDILV